MTWQSGLTATQPRAPGADGTRQRWVLAALALSRVALWGVGVLAALSVSHAAQFGLGSTGDVLAAPVLSDDARWFTAIALHGYPAIPHSAAYLPLYPLVLSIAGAGGLAVVTIFGTFVSSVAFATALWLLYRLVRLDFGEQVAMRTAVLLAVFPTAVFFTTAYAESLFLVLTVGAFYAARLERWSIAALLAALAGGTRITGIVLAVALLCLYLFGPRGPERFNLQDRWRIRFPLGRDALWIALVPAGYLAFALYTQIALGDALANVHEGPYWGVTFHGPLFGLVDGTNWGMKAVWALISGSHTEPARVLLGHVAGFVFLPFAILATVGAFRRLPLGYAVYSLLSLAPALTNYVTAHPLTSLQRYMAVLFPLHLWLALWASTKLRYALCLAISIIGLIGCAALFATAHLA